MEDNESLTEQIRSMADIFRHSTKKVCRLSLFWEKLNQRHVELLRRHGFSQFKKTVNFNYSQWRVAVPWDPKLLIIFIKLICRREFPWIGFLAKIKNSEHIIEWPLPAFFSTFIYKFFVGMIWQYAIAKDREEVLKTCEEPRCGSPLEIIFEEKLISQDLALSSLEFNQIATITDLTKVSTIAEIGAGYGRLAHIFSKMLPSIEFDIFDIPPALAISQSYLTHVFSENKVSKFRNDHSKESIQKHPKEENIRIFLPHQLELFPDQSFDLIINISSFDEMNEEQIHYYFDLIEKKGRGWLYLKGFAHRNGKDKERPFGLRQFPYRKSWKLIHEANDVFKYDFIEQIYDLRR